MNKMIEKMRKDGYPYKIKGNGGHTAVLYELHCGVIEQWISI